MVGFTHLGDCLEIMKSIQSNKIDMILTDLPYGNTACSWDVLIPFELLWKEFKRIIKSSGNIVLTSSQPFTSMLVCSNLDWFSHSLVWEKEQGVNFLSGNIMPLKKHEDICIFRKPNSYGITEFIELRQYFKDLLSKTGRTKKQIMDEFGQGLDHCFRYETDQWGLPTENNYNLLISKYNLNLIPYSKLKEKYQDEFFRIYNPQRTKGQPYISGKGNSGDVTGNVKKVQTINDGTRLPTSIIKFNRETGLHPTQKPVDLFEYLIKTYSNEENIVLDCCAGSGTTAIACLNTNRNYVCIEKEKQYFDIMEERIKNHVKPTEICKPW